MRHARQGHRFFAVDAPGVFREIELPTYRDDDTPAQRRLRDELEALAEQHHTHVTACPHQRG